ncbi:hypothetical protein [Streptomyces sp. NPDC020983]|uniref:hypothetical protein n=1 Tax=Streptomyces sp. NPDC020983 TaxID=3365106 RepID=UPI0037BC3917
MYGPGITQPPRPPAGRGAVIWLRVLFTALPVLSFGLLAWASPLRLAVTRRNPADWALMVIDIVLVVTGYMLIGFAQDNTDSWQSNVGTLTVLVVSLGTPAYFLTADIRRRPVVLAGYPVPHGYPARSPYAAGYGPAAGGAAAGIPMSHPVPHRTPVPQQTPAPHRTPAPQTPAPHGTPDPSNGAAAAGPPPPRIQQVRAELDELSDYLRKEEGR